MTSKDARVGALVEACRGQAFDARYLAYFECFNRGWYFEAHDALEPLWLAGRHGPNHRFYKGLIQLAAAFVHLQKNRLRPAVALFKLADGNFRNYAEWHEGLDVQAILAMSAQWRERVELFAFQQNLLTVDTGPRLVVPRLRPDVTPSLQQN